MQHVADKASHDSCHDVVITCHDEVCAGQDSQQAMKAHIAPIKEVLPDFGDGFLAAALQHFSYNSEQVIHALLEGALPPALKVLDPHMPLQSPSQQPAKGSKADPRGSGKGKTRMPVAATCRSSAWHWCIHMHIHTIHTLNPEHQMSSP